MPLSSFERICKDAKVSLETVLMALSFIAKEGYKFSDRIVFSVNLVLRWFATPTGLLI